MEFEDYFRFTLFLVFPLDFLRESVNVCKPPKSALFAWLHTTLISGREKVLIGDYTERHRSSLFQQQQKGVITLTPEWLLIRNGKGFYLKIKMVAFFRYLCLDQ